MPDQVSRKDFVTLFGTAVAVEALKTAETAEAATTHRALPAPPLGNEPEAYTFLTEPEAKFVEAAVERLIPIISTDKHGMWQTSLCAVPVHFRKMPVTMTGTVGALAYHTADAVLNKYIKTPGPLV